MHPSTYGSVSPQEPPKPVEHEPLWQTKVPFGIETGDGTLIAKAMRAYRPETSEEEELVQFFIHEFEKLDAKHE